MEGVIFINNIITKDDGQTVMVIKRRNGDTYEVLISKKDINKINSCIWHLGWRKDIQKYYVEHCKYIGTFDGKPKYKTIMLHRFLTDATENEFVDHINHDTLDNRRENLRKIERQQNIQNRSGKNRNNKSGYRNVFWDNKENKWCVTLCRNYKRIMIGYFDDVHEAGIAAKEAREKHYEYNIEDIKI